MSSSTLTIVQVVAITFGVMVAGAIVERVIAYIYDDTEPPKGKKRKKHKKRG